MDDSEPSLAGDSLSSARSLARGGGAAPELLLGLSYSAATGRMAVEIIKGSRFRNMAAGKPPGTSFSNSSSSSSCCSLSRSFRAPVVTLPVLFLMSGPLAPQTRSPG